MNRLCRCGHSREQHLHLRSGTDCSHCYPTCTAYRPRISVARIVGRQS